jgi:hypothetical protein
MIIFPSGITLTETQVDVLLDTLCIEENLQATPEEIIERWIMDGLVTGKVSNCKKRFMTEWQQRLIDDPDVESVPADVTRFVTVVTARADYKNRAQREIAKAVSD